MMHFVSSSKDWLLGVRCVVSEPEMGAEKLSVVFSDVVDNVHCKFQCNGFKLSSCYFLSLNLPVELLFSWIKIDCL